MRIGLRAGRCEYFDHLIEPYSDDVMLNQNQHCRSVNGQTDLEVASQLAPQNSLKKKIDFFAFLVFWDLSFVPV